MCTPDYHPDYPARFKRSKTVKVKKYTLFKNLNRTPLFRRGHTTTTARPFWPPATHRVAPFQNIHLFFYPNYAFLQSNIDIIQRFQNKVLRIIVSAPWYIRNNDPHRDLEVDVVSGEIQRFAQKKHEERLHHPENVEDIQLLDNMGIVRRLRRKKTF